MRTMHTLLRLSAYATAPRPMRPATTVRAVKLQDPALAVMTDFAHEHPITVSESRRIEDALEDMVALEVRALLVLRAEVIVGLITSYDIQGERPMKFLLSSTYTRHDEILVGHVMTPWERVPALDWGAVCEARVSDILAVFHETDASHLPVLQTTPDGHVLLRGLMSRAQLERQLAA
jgi:DeoR family transcriptional regulator, catabolite repression regulator